MATSKPFKNFVVEQLSLLDNITCRPMMGGYLFYYNGILFGGLYADRFLVKIVDSNKKYNLKEEEPYEHAKLMYLIENLDDQELIRDIVIDTCHDLPIKK